MDGVDLSAELRRPVPTLQDVPPFMRAAVRRALVAALTRESSDPVGLPACRAWKLFLLAPRMLLARTDERGAQGRALLLARARAFEQGDWLRLLRAAQQPPKLALESVRGSCPVPGTCLRPRSSPQETTPPGAR